MRMRMMRSSKEQEKGHDEKRVSSRAGRGQWVESRVFSWAKVTERRWHQKRHFFRRWDAKILIKG